MKNLQRRRLEGSRKRRVEGGKPMRPSPLLAGFAIAALLSASCASNPLDTKTKQGAVIGAIGGALAGAAIGGKDHRAGGALIGAATGAVAGGLLGRYLDNQARELDAIPGADVQRRDDSLLVNFSSQLLFDTGASQLQPGAYDRMRTLAGNLNNYPQSQVIIKGHTDNVGDDRFNQRLSEERADRVRAFLVSEGVASSRISAIGFGEA